MSAPLVIRRIHAQSPELERLIALSERYMSALYPAESNHFENVEALLGPKGWMLGVWIADRLVACGAVKIMDDDGRYGEVKRVFVLDEHRGKGISKAIMQALEDHLRAQGVPMARLETGVKQPEAIGLYRRLGYLERGPFGGYRADPLSLFMEKSLG